MWQESALEILKSSSTPMTAREISEIIRPEVTIEKKAEARAKTSKALSKLREYKMVEIVGAEETKPFGKLWRIVED